jgi:signal transduction histidine kinase
MTHLIIVVFVVFALWEGAKHIWLMDIPMAAYHLTSLIVEVSLTLVIAVVALRAVRRQGQQDVDRRVLHDAVVGVLAQDLRPLLVSLLAQVKAVEGSAPPAVAAELRELLEGVAARGGALLDAIEGLVTVVEGGAGEPRHCRSLSPAELAREVVEVYRPRAEQRGLTLSVSVSEGMPPAYRASDHILRVLSILLSYVIGLTSPGGEVELQVSRGEEASTVVFSVTNTEQPLGDHATALSEVANAKARAELRYCELAVEAMGGAARYEPRPDGNAFLVELPGPAEAG